MTPVSSVPGLALALVVTMGSPAAAQERSTARPVRTAGGVPPLRTLGDEEPLRRPWFRPTALDAVLGHVFEDVDGDGVLDYVMGTTSNLEVHRGRGDGEFLPPELYSPASSPVRFADFDGDGDRDLLAFDATGARAFLVHFANGEGGFSGFTRTQYFGGAGALLTGDWDLDGDLDVVVPYSVTGNVVLFKNNGNATFAGPFPNFVSMGGFFDAVVVDMNGDEYPDIVGGGNQVGILLNNEGSGFQVSTTRVGVGTARVAVADFDGSGTPDVAAGVDGKQVAIFLNDGTGTLGTPTFYSTGATIEMDNDPLWAFDADGVVL